MISGYLHAAKELNIEPETKGIKTSLIIKNRT